VLLTGLCVVGPGGAAADDPAKVTVRVEIDNATGAALECQALAAHWYSFPVQRAAPGGSVWLALTFLPAVGEVNAEPASPLPIELLYCGRAGRAWATRAGIDVRAIAARAAAAGGTARVGCRDDGEAVVCAAVP
jgi:hypothetical protein